MSTQTQYEYKVEIFSTDPDNVGNVGNPHDTSGNQNFKEFLNVQGEDGWLLIQTIHRADTGPTGSWTRITCIFYRPLSS